MSDWEIKRPSGVCAGSGADIEPGNEYYAALVDSEEGLLRKDYSLEYWNENTPNVFYFWKAKMPDPEQKKQLFIDDDMLMAFFNRLESEQEQEKINFRFVLCLVLMRKRLLKYESCELVDEDEVWTLKVTGQKSNVKVVNPNLTEEQIDELTENLGQIMQVEIEE